MSNYKNWNKKAALFASGLIYALAFRLPISTASFCVVRFNLDPSHLNIFTSQIVNGMLFGQLFGNWLGVLLTALDGKGKLWTLVAANWLCLASFCFALFFFCHSEEGHLTCFYWSVFIVNFFAKVSEAQCLEIATPDSTNWYVSTFTLSYTYISLVKYLLLKLITVNEPKNANAIVTGVATRSVKSTVDYRVCMLTFAITIILMLLICALWTAVSIIATNGNLESSNIKWLKYANGVSTGGILSAPGALFGAPVGSMFGKLLGYCLTEAAWLKGMEYRHIIFCVVGVLISFGSVIAGIKDMPNEAEQWVASSKWQVNVDVGKYVGWGFGAGVFLGVCFGTIVVRFKANICRSMVLCIIAGSLLGSAVGILIYKRSSSFVKLNANPTSDATMNDHNDSKVVESDGFNASTSNSSGETIEELLKKNVDVRDLPTLDIIKGWADHTVDGDYTGVDQNNNKWAKSLQKIGEVDVTRYGYWNFLNTKVESIASTHGNIVRIKSKFHIPDASGQSLFSSEHEKIKNSIHETLHNVSNGSMMVMSVTGEGTNHGTVEFSVEVRVNGNVDENNITIFAEHGLKNVGRVAYSMKWYWDFTEATVNKSGGVSDGGFGGQKGNNQLTVTLNVIGAKNGDVLDSGEKGEGKIKKAIQDLFDRELGLNSVKLEKIDVLVAQDQVKIALTPSRTENVWTRALRNLQMLQLNTNDHWDLSRATVAVCSVTQQVTTQFKIIVNLEGAKEKQTPTKDEKNRMNEALQEIFDNAYGDRAVAAEQLTAHVNAENTITIAFNLKKKENVWTECIRNIDYVNVNNRGEWELSKGKLVTSDLLKRGDYIKIDSTLSGTCVLGQTMDSTEEKRLKSALQKEFDHKLKNRGVRVTSVTGMTKLKGQIVFTIQGHGRGSTFSESEKLMIKRALHTVFDKGKVKYLRNTYWDLKKAKVDLTSRAVTTIGDTIKITATDVIGASNGDTFEELDEDRIKRPLQEALNKTIGDDRVMVTSVKGQATHIGKVELIVGVEEKIKTNKVVSMRSRREVLTKKNSTTEDDHSSRKSEVIGGWMSSLIMNVLGLGTVYAVYPGMAPCSITDASYFNKINTVIQIVSAIPPIVIIYFSETKSGGPEKRWEEEGKVWYFGLLFVMIQIVSMIIFVFVVHRPNSNLAKIVKSSPVTGGALTVLMVLCQVTSTSIGYAGVVGNSGSTMMTFNNTATLITMVFMSLLGEGYLTELKKYEPGMWPTQSMGKCEGLRWWFGRVFVNVWNILMCIWTKDLRRDLNIFATNSKHSSAVIFV